MTTPTRPVDVSRLTKTFGSFRAVDELNLAVDEGTVHGFLGPNGAGKSTTLRVLLGLYRRSSGDVTVLGLDPTHDSAAINARISYVAGDVALWPNLTGQEVLDVLAGLRGSYDKKREAELIEAYALDPTKKARAYSKGNRQKLILIAAFAARTDLMLLDEPTSGLDPLMEQVFRRCVSEAVAEGRTVLLSSHILSEVEQLCSEVTIIKDGRLVESGHLADMRHLAASHITADFPGPVPEPVVTGLRPYGIEVAPDASRVDASVPRDDVAEVLGVISASGVDGITCTPASLEDLFLQHYEVAAR